MSRYKYEMLLAAQLLLAVISPLFSSTANARTIIDIAISVVFVTAIYVISNSRKHFIIGLVLMVPAFILIWGVKLYYIQTLEYISLIGSALFFCYVTWLILVDIFRAKLVSLDIIAGGISVYLFLGNIYGLIYALIGKLDPDAFSIPELTASYLGDNIGDVSSAMYFSFVTLTTLGYGDITPISSFARTLAYLEAAMGQFYLTVLIAGLVGVHIASSYKGGSS